MLYSMFFIILLSLSGCNSSGSNNDINKSDASTECGTLGACCNDGVLVPCMVSSSITSSSSSSEAPQKVPMCSTPPQPISNLGKNMNTNGYYGEDVLFGNESVVGEWYPLEHAGAVGRMAFHNDGTGDISTIFYGGSQRAIEWYSVNDTGTKLCFKWDGAIYCLRIISKKDCCYEIEHSWGTSPPIYPDQIFDRYTLCKLSEL